MPGQSRISTGGTDGGTPASGMIPSGGRSPAGVPRTSSAPRSARHGSRRGAPVTGVSLRVLARRFPRFTFGTRQMRDGVSFEAVRHDRDEPGVYAVITDDLTEMREALLEDQGSPQLALTRVPTIVRRVPVPSLPPWTGRGPPRSSRAARCWCEAPGAHPPTPVPRAARPPGGTACGPPSPVPGRPPPSSQTREILATYFAGFQVIPGPGTGRKLRGPRLRQRGEDPVPTTSSDERTAPVHDPAPVADFTKPSETRIFNAMSGGKDNFAPDREAADAIEAMFPGMSALVRQHREFARRAAGWLHGEGVHQFLDVGCGLPLPPTVGQAVPCARVAYVDSDPVAVTHLRALAARDGVAVVAGDAADPGRVLAAPELAGVINLDEPVGVLLAGRPVGDEPGGRQERRTGATRTRWCQDQPSRSPVSVTAIRRPGMRRRKRTGRWRAGRSAPTRGRRSRVLRRRRGCVWRSAVSATCGHGGSPCPWLSGP